MISLLWVHMYTEASTEVVNRLWHWVEINNHYGQSFKETHSELSFQKKPGDLERGDLNTIVL